ncbi:DUF4232 domain-containing protein [Glycomyces salinus]|uniref:DUF4232 domain-containing protein n=1 Tax=Glycomyces salinus TaxID=980294 RepID=UPI0018ED84EF|nr:DUF4232 domain-containing protein [Glycomyces salinus]
MRRHPLLLVPLLASALLLASCGQGQAGSEGGSAQRTGCTEDGVSVSVTDIGQVEDTGFLTIGLSNCGEETVLLDSRPNVGVFGGDVVFSRDGNEPESFPIEAGQTAFATASWGAVDPEAETVTVDRLLINAPPLAAAFEVDVAEPFELNSDQRADLTAWQLAGPDAPVDETEPTEPAETEEPDAATCPEEGFRVTVSGMDAAMGLRATGIELVNCGSADIEVNGYPVIEIPGADVEVREGSDTLEDAGPTPITVAPGESVNAGMMWRNKVESANSEDVVDATEIYVGYAEDSPTQLVEPEHSIDLGTERSLEVTAWR